MPDARELPKTKQALPSIAGYHLFCLEVNSTDPIWSVGPCGYNRAWSAYVLPWSFHDQRAAALSKDVQINTDNHAYQEY